MESQNLPSTNPSRAIAHSHLSMMQHPFLHTRPVPKEIVKQHYLIDISKIVIFYGKRILDDVFGC